MAYVLKVQRKDIAEVLGISVRTLRRHELNGMVDLSEFLSMCQYVVAMTSNVELPKKPSVRKKTKKKVKVVKVKTPQLSTTDVHYGKFTMEHAGEEVVDTPDW